MTQLKGLALALVLTFVLAGCRSPVFLRSSQRDPGAACADVTRAGGAYPLAEPGPYAVSRMSLAIEDAAREGRRIGVVIWYPTVPPGDLKRTIQSDAEPDRGGAPYPLIVSAVMTGEALAPYVVSHGFVWASVAAIYPYRHMGASMIDHPLDILYMLDHLASNPPDALQGLIDAEHTGAVGYSFDGYNTLAMSGARIDPAYYLAQCPDPDPATSAVISDLSAFHCAPADAWDAYVAHVPERFTVSDDGLWQPMTDPRVRAVMPMAAEGWWLFGTRGLAEVDRPVLMLAGTLDELYRENVLIYEHLGTTDKRLISFVGQDHELVYEPEMIARVAHLATAFLGYHLQGREAWGACFSKEFVVAHDDLAWDVYATD
jgi:predicted dienelactone hydrolase